MFSRHSTPTSRPPETTGKSRWPLATLASTATWSDADRLENGNTLVAFGVRGFDDLARLVEVTSEGEVVWDVAFPGSWSLYRAHRAEPLPGFVL